ncbi:thioesterase-like superfamily-domain-containing protein [Protomyces lactucae-debilis]|uniref:Thioesterase-like superfamily-domain-containing protein n=1 Tax=Protomyces lactucae-debilis TaxID=2754530 RepID=A0A1Y2FFG8_PROLT|nr:thioesterase-like superfamily-domain-containing protein [Protomyces lactucae-debilis]ORY82710.1 thioesterase-like superfamily-domain-containing protein [Protomyces lactucae-debilis]
MSAFATAIAVEATQETGVYAANLLQTWCIGAVPHGGYLLAIILNALETHSKQVHAKLDQPDPIQLGVHFIVKAQVGPARILVKDIKTGRNYSNCNITFQQKEQDGRWISLIHGFAIMGNLEREEGPSVLTTDRHADIPDRKDCKQLDPEYTEFRRVAKNFDYLLPTFPYDRATELNWLKFKDDAEMDLLAIGLISDLMTPLPLRVIENEKGWYPTLSLDLQFKQRPKKGGKWCYLQVQSESLLNGRFDITTRGYDEDKNLIMVSQHAALRVSAERNLKKRAERPANL